MKRKRRIAKRRVLVRCRNRDGGGGGGWAVGAGSALSCHVPRAAAAAAPRRAWHRRSPVPLLLSLSLPLPFLSLRRRPRAFRSLSFVARKMCVCLSERPNGRGGCPWDLTLNSKRREPVLVLCREDDFVVDIL